MVRRILTAVLLAWAALWIVGCQTVQGLGRDITWLGGGGNPPSKR